MDAIEKIKQAHKIQGSDGNWNIDPYMQGMFNGIEYCLAILEDRPPEFKTAPEHWISK